MTALPSTFDSSTDIAAQSVDPYEDQVKLEQILLSGDISPQTHQTIEQEIGSAGTSGAQDGKHPPNVNTTVALLLGSPEFQRR